MRVQRVADGHKPGVKPNMAVSAPPWIDSQNTQKVVSRRLAARASRIFAFADRAGHLGIPGIANFADRIGESLQLSKRNKVLLAPVEWSYVDYNSLLRDAHARVH